MENLAIHYFSFTAFHSAVEFLNEQQIFGLQEEGAVNTVITPPASKAKDIEAKRINEEYKENVINIIIHRRKQQYAFR